MPISGLLLTLYDTANPTDVLESLEQIDGVECGTPNDRWIPIAIDTPNAKSSRQLHDQLLSIEGVASVDVVSVSFEGAFDTEPNPPALPDATNPPTTQS